MGLVRDFPSQIGPVYAVLIGAIVGIALMPFRPIPPYCIRCCNPELAYSIHISSMLHFVDDFEDLIGVDYIDPNWMGMIDMVVASRGRAFCGTYRSTFSGYINRLRGYYGLSMNNSWFGQLDEKCMMHEWRNVNLDTFAREWPDA
jgi:hypothetical protein